MKKYIITSKTNALIKKENKTLVIEDNNSFYLNNNIEKILDYNCKYYGSDLKGRKSSVATILNTKYKNPILISNNLIFFPTSSIRMNNSMFINYKKIAKYSNKNEILLINNKLLTLKISKYIFNEQLIKCILLENIIKTRNNQ